ncbi:MAG: CPBP family intramembrane metalloprotease [Bdellovibrionales bacterium]|nr:CPBP family intramembrane metalloprotease [Bdellovibrionales bacterium]
MDTQIGRQIVKLALWSELALILLGAPWFLLEPVRSLNGWDLEGLLAGAAMASIMLAVSFALSSLAEYAGGEHSKIAASLQRTTPTLAHALQQIYRFQREIVHPLCEQISVPQALLIAVFSGVGEELFFRGLLSSLLFKALPFSIGLLAVNFLFAIVHFLDRTKEFWAVVPLYVVAGLCFSYVTEYQGSLFGAMIAHALFNFVSITVNRTSQGNRQQ